jgi:hypothetical protein
VLMIGSFSCVKQHYPIAPMVVERSIVGNGMISVFAMSTSNISYREAPIIMVCSKVARALFRP